MKLASIVMATVLMVGVSTTLQAQATTLAQIQSRWAEVNYTLEGDPQEKAFEALLKEAHAWTDAEPNNAEAFIWRGIIQSTFAGAKGGLGALGLAKDARKSLERALELDPRALQGSAYGSLGTLYYKVPGWPLGFGNDKKAEEYLLKALDINPTGIDPNYFYADYLYEQGNYTQAQQVAERALQAPPRPQRALADAQRRMEIEALLKKIAKKVG
ncbi:hypothetical protein LG272_06425 [Pseudidiomarina marina]|uniref:tetratricopeptide repeat protein n=1 Tax=Pseudidiomarina marina TaxID=502366 RepID=UPI00384BA462